MTNVTLPAVADARKLSFFLAMEEYVARQQWAGDAFFLWQAVSMPIATT